LGRELGELLANILGYRVISPVHRKGLDAHQSLVFIVFFNHLKNVPVLGLIFRNDSFILQGFIICPYFSQNRLDSLLGRSGLSSTYLGSVCICSANVFFVIVEARPLMR
jgi:hypothetical protein